MSASDISFPVPDDFEKRASETYARLAGGEAMTHEQIADALGLPPEFFAAACAIYASLMGRQPVIIAPVGAHSSNRKLN